MVNVLNIRMNKRTQNNTAQSHHGLRNDAPSFYDGKKPNLQPKHNPNKHQKKDGIRHDAGRILKMLLIAHG